MRLPPGPIAEAFLDLLGESGSIAFSSRFLSSCTASTGLFCLIWNKGGPGGFYSVGVKIFLVASWAGFVYWVSIKGV